MIYDLHEDPPNMFTSLYGKNEFNPFFKLYLNVKICFYEMKLLNEVLTMMLLNERRSTDFGKVKLRWQSTDTAYAFRNSGIAYVFLFVFCPKIFQLVIFIMSLKRAHRICIKFMQSLPKSTSTDVTLALIGLYPIESEIDYKKFVFLGLLCRLPGDHRVKEVFNYRLVHFNESPSKKLGFLPDIYRILNKYSIVHILDEYMQTVFRINFLGKN